jgi:hypothetical protein
MDDSEARLFQVIRNDKPLEDYTFKKLAECENPSRWLIPLKDRDYFSGDKNPPPQEVEDQPGFYTIPLWNVLPYLENVAKKNKERPEAQITGALSQIVDSIIGYRDGKGQRVDNYRTDWFVTKIVFMLPCKIWNERHIAFIGTALRTAFGGSLVQSEIGKSVLPALIENKAKDLILELLEVILGFTKVSEDNGDKIKPLMDKHWLRHALTKFKKDIAELCGAGAVDIGLQKIRAVSDIDQGSFSHVWIPSIEDSVQTDFPDKYANQLVSFVREMLEKLPAEVIRTRIESLVKEQHDIFKRLAIHTINHHYENLGDLFWNWEGNPLEESELHHEVYVLLKQNCEVFNPGQIDRLIEWIEGITYANSGDPEKEKLEARRRKRWLSAVEQSDSPKLKDLQKKYDAIFPGQVDHPSFLIWSEGGHVRHISPVPQPKLESMSNQEIADFLKEWREKDTWGLEVVSQTGLSNALRECVRNNPTKFASDLAPFLDVDPVYQRDLVRAFGETWNAKKPFSVDAVLGFIEQVLGSDEFWKIEHEPNYRNWLVSEIAEFIETGTGDNKHAFERKELPRIERILLILADPDGAQSTVDEQTGRLIDSVLNSPRGAVFSAMLSCSLWYARSVAKDKQAKWPDKIKQDFTEKLNRRAEPAVDFSVTLGKYLRYLAVLDEKWVFENIERIFPKQDERHWRAGFGSYVSYSQRVYEKIYSLLRANGHYTKGLDTEFEDQYVTQKLVQHICIAFLEDWEKVSEPNSLMCRLLDIGNADQLSEVVSFLGRLEGDEPRKKLKERIKPLWKRMFEVLQTRQEQPEWQRLIGGLHLWLGLVDEIDDEVQQWSVLTARYIRAQFHESGLVEQLAKHVDKTPDEVGRIYIEMLNAGTYPTYRETDIRKVVENLYRKGEKEHADTICNMYGEVGQYFLRDLYEQNHSSEAQV